MGVFCRLLGPDLVRERSKQVQVACGKCFDLVKCFWESCLVVFWAGVTFKIPSAKYLPHTPQAFWSLLVSNEVRERSKQLRSP